MIKINETYIKELGIDDKAIFDFTETIPVVMKAESELIHEVFVSAVKYEDSAYIYHYIINKKRNTEKIRLKIKKTWYNDILKNEQYVSDRTEVIDDVLYNKNSLVTNFIFSMSEIFITCFNRMVILYKYILDNVDLDNTSNADICKICYEGTKDKPLGILEHPVVNDTVYINISMCNLMYNVLSKMRTELNRDDSYSEYYNLIISMRIWNDTDVILKYFFDLITNHTPDTFFFTHNHNSKEYYINRILFLTHCINILESAKRIE